MIRMLYALSFAVMTSAMIAGCAEDRHSDRQRPAYSFENVDMGQPGPGRQYRFDEPPPASRNDPYSRGQSGRY